MSLHLWPGRFRLASPSRWLEPQTDEMVAHFRAIGVPEWAILPDGSLVTLALENEGWTVTDDGLTPPADG